MTDVTTTVRYFAAARAAAGTEEEKVQLASGSTVAQLLDTIRADRPELARVLERCSYLLDEVSLRDRSTVLPDDSTLDVLPPFAGG